VKTESSDMGVTDTRLPSYNMFGYDVNPELQHKRVVQVEVTMQDTSRTAGTNGAVECQADLTLASIDVQRARNVGLGHNNRFCWRI